MRVLFDTNVVLDVLLDRGSHAGPAAALMACIDNGLIEGSVCATTVTTIYYVAAKALGRDRALGALRRVLAVFAVASVDQAVLVAALWTGWPDFEDAVLHQATLVSGLDAIVTCDAAGFAGSLLPVFEPGALLAALGDQTD